MGYLINYRNAVFLSSKWKEMLPWQKEWGASVLIDRNQTLQQEIYKNSGGGGGNWDRYTTFRQTIWTAKSTLGSLENTARAVRLRSSERVKQQSPIFSVFPTFYWTVDSHGCATHKNKICTLRFYRLMALLATAYRHYKQDVWKTEIVLSFQ